MKTYFIASLLVLIHSNYLNYYFCSDIEKCTLEISCKKVKIVQSKKWNRTLSLIINLESMNGDIENLNYGEMSENVYDLIYKNRYRLDNNQKIDLLASFLCLQNHYLGAYYNALYNDNNHKYLKSNRQLLLLFAPFNNCPKEILESKLDTTFIKTLTPENRLLFQLTDSLLKTRIDNEKLESKYELLLFKHITSKSFLEKYRNYFGNSKPS